MKKYKREILLLRKGERGNREGKKENKREKLKKTTPKGIKRSTKNSIVFSVDVREWYEKWAGVLDAVWQTRVRVMDAFRMHLQKHC